MTVSMALPTLDPRLTPARPDLAAEALRGAVQAERYVAGAPAAVSEPIAALRRRPAADAPLETQALYGESLTVFDEAEGWSWVQLGRDGYVGYVESSALGKSAAPTHRVAALRTHAYPGPSIKLPPLRALGFNACVRIVREAPPFLIAEDGAHYYAMHLAPLEARELDFVAVAERFLESPYLWGGRSSEGIDCSGLAQNALTSAGIAAPRDTDMQEAQLGTPLPEGAALQRGDLVFWKGHIGLMQDATRLIHANGWHMKVVSEPLKTAKDRISASGGGPVTSIRRL